MYPYFILFLFFYIVLLISIIFHVIFITPKLSLLKLFLNQSHSTYWKITGYMKITNANPLYQISMISTTTCKFNITHFLSKNLLLFEFHPACPAWYKTTAECSIYDQYE